MLSTRLTRLTSETWSVLCVHILEMLDLLLAGDQSV